jgi:hypothetical protein
MTNDIHSGVGTYDSQEAVARGKTVTIIVNTKPHVWAEDKISFEQVVELALPGQPYEPEGTTVEYSRGHGKDHSLRPGGSVEVKDGMIFDVERANRS